MSAVSHFTTHTGLWNSIAVVSSVGYDVGWGSAVSENRAECGHVRGKKKYQFEKE